jgi:hypothetical protein
MTNRNDIVLTTKHTNFHEESVFHPWFIRGSSSVLAFILYNLSFIISFADTPWRGYTVYQPRIERAVVVDASAQPLRYNHDSSVAWFRDRWFCVWNANTIPEEGAPGQLNYVSTSRDGLAWSAPRAVFSDPALSANPVPCPKGTQWQPNLLVVGDRLWCLWSQNSKDTHNGCYFSVLDAPDGLWTNRLLTWSGETDPVIDGKPFRIFPTQNPARLGSGRVLAPVTLIGPVSASAPAGKSGWYWQEKRDSVLYTDDDGTAWHVSPGATLPGLDWRQWEPTVFEQPGGTVLMFARNNFIPGFENAAIRPEETLTWSLSRDGGATWTPHAYVPLETVVSRMHVLRQPGSDRFLMLHNDRPAGRFGADRRNLALFVNRGGGIDFTAGTGLTGNEPETAYPQMDIRGDSLLFVYSQGSCAMRSIRAVRVSPLPDPDQLYLYPRSNLPPPPQCVFTNGALQLSGGASIPLAGDADGLARGSASDRITLSAEINPAADGVLFDNRGPKGGFVWGLGGTAFVHLGDPNKNIRSTLPVPHNRWSRVGVTVDYPQGEVLFRVNDDSERVAFKSGRRSLSGTSATLFGPNLASSVLPPFEGAARSLILDGTNRVFDAAAPAVYAQYGGTYGTAELKQKNNFKTLELPHFSTSSPSLLRLAGNASAGVELPANERASGDAVEFEFAFRLERGTTGTLCTIGDALQPARVAVRGDGIVLHAAGDQQLCGKAAPGTWQRLSLLTQADFTRVTLDANPAATVCHAPQATWLYLGEGYPSSALSADTAFSIDVPSVRSRCSPPR